MPKSKNRPNHKQKLEARRRRMNETTNMKKKQVKEWIAQMQQSIQNQQLQTEVPNIVDVNQATPVVEEIPQETPPTNVGGSGAL